MYVWKYEIISRRIYQANEWDILVNTHISAHHLFFSIYSFKKCICMYVLSVIFKITPTLESIQDSRPVKANYFRAETEEYSPAELRATGDARNRAGSEFSRSCGGFRSPYRGPGNVSLSFHWECTNSSFYTRCNEVLIFLIVRYKNFIPRYQDVCDFCVNLRVYFLLSFMEQGKSKL